VDVNAYLDRLEVSDGTDLAVLHRAHQTTVPFENLSIHLGEPISLAADDLIDKVVRRRRGGFCYELNGAFALLLEALGYGVVRVSASVHGAGGYGPPFDHLALLVTPPGSDETRGETWLADVGFGSHSTFPLRFDRRDEQVDPGGRFRLADAGEGDVEVFKDGEPQYRIERRARALSDFEPTCWWQSTSPASHFTQGTICSRIVGDGRTSISGRTLIRTTAAGRTEEPLDTDEALRTAYREHFGFALEKLPVS